MKQFSRQCLLLHTTAVIVDAHCDTLTALEKQNRHLNERSNAGHVDLPRLRQGGVRVQFFAAFVAPEYRFQPVLRVIEILDRFYRELEICSGEMILVKNFEDIERAVTQGKIAALLSVEGGEALAGCLEVLRILHRLGVRSLTLTWNNRNELGDGVFERAGGGLTFFGVEVVREMNRLNMLVDVSHLAEAGFWDVLKVSTRPVIASHSNSRKICDHPRNLTDEQIKALARQGGVMGLCFYPRIVHPDRPCLEKLLDHVDHIANVAGVDCIGLGSDFDGIEETLPCLKDPTQLPAFTEGLLRRGYRAEEISKILGGNFMRVLQDL